MVKNSYMGPTQYSVVRLHRLPSKFAKFVRCIFLNCCSTIDDRNTNLVFRLEDQRQLERKIYKTRLNRVLKTKKLIVYILPNSFCTPLELPKIGFTPKSRDLSQKTKKMAAILKLTSEILQDKSRQYFAFFTSSH